MDKTGIIIQARMGSERLPGKILKPLAGGKAVLSWVVERCREVKTADLVIVATTDSPQDDETAHFCGEHGYPVFRGSESDVLGRYLECAKAYGLTAIVRATSDCPFIAPEIIEEMIDRFQKSGADYVNNSRLTKTFPRGLDVEVVSRKALEKVAASPLADQDREHVTIYIYQHAGDFRIETVEAAPAYRAPELRLTIDTPEDLRMANKVAEHFKTQGPQTSAVEIIAFLREHPEVAAINQEVKQKPINGVTI